jgi:hypothetical protein
VDEDEDILEVAHATFVAHPLSMAGGILAITSRRFLFVRKRPFRQRFVVKSVPLVAVRNFAVEHEAFGLDKITLKTKDERRLSWTLTRSAGREGIVAYLLATYREEPTLAPQPRLAMPAPQPFEKWRRDEPPGRLRPPF